MVDVPRSPLISNRRSYYNPWDYGSRTWVWQTTITHPIAEALPRNQYNWPLPLLPWRLDSSFRLFSIDLGTFTPPKPFNQEDWPVPKPKDVLGVSRVYQSYPLVYSEPLPFNEYDWPVPRAKDRLGVNYNYQSYPLTFSETMPVNEYNWPVPPWPSRIARTWIQTPIFEEKMPINEYDWPLGRAKATLTVSWTQSSNVDLLTFVEQNPFFQTDWPLGRAKDRLSVSFTYQAYPLVFAEDQPFNQHDWPNPLRVDQVAKTWLQRPYTLYDKGRPHNQYDWPLRRDKDRLNVSFNYQAYPLATVEPLPFENYDWPVPRAKDRLNVSYNYQSYPVTFAEPLPFENYDWPVPKAKDRLTVSWTQPTNIDLLTEEIIKPFFQTDWPVPLRAIHPIQLRTWIQGTPVLITSLEVQPQNQHDWPLPSVAAKLNPSFTLRPLPLFQAEEMPQNQHDWPVPIRVDRVGKTWLNFTRQEPKPFGKQTFNPPLRPIYPNSLLTWTQAAGRYQEQKPVGRQPDDPSRVAFRLSSTARGTPVNLVAMGVLPPGRAQGIILAKPPIISAKLGTPTNLLEAIAELVPFNRRTDFYVPPKVSLRYAGSQSSSVALLTFVAEALPKNQYSWPLPTPMRAKGIEGHERSSIALITAVIVPPPPANYRYPLMKQFYPFRSVGWVNPYPIGPASQPDPTKTFGQRRYIAGLEWQPWDRSSEPRGWPY